MITIETTPQTEPPQQRSTGWSVRRIAASPAGPTLLAADLSVLSILLGWRGTDTAAHFFRVGLVGARRVPRLEQLLVRRPPHAGLQRAVPGPRRSHRHLDRRRDQRGGVGAAVRPVPAPGDRRAAALGIAVVRRRNGHEHRHRTLAVRTRDGDRDRRPPCRRPSTTLRSPACSRSSAPPPVPSRARSSH